MKAKRKRITKTKMEIVSSTAFALSKNPNMYDNVKEYQPDQKANKAKRLAREQQAKKDKFAKLNEELNKQLKSM